MRIVIDAVGIRGHGGAAVLSELISWLPQVRPDWQWHLFLLQRPLREFSDLPVADTVDVRETRWGNSALGRLRWVNTLLPRQAKDLSADVVFGFANLGNRNPRIPQVVYCHQLNAFSDSHQKGIFSISRLRMRFLRRAILRGARCSEAIIVQTAAMRDRMASFAPSLRERIHVIPGGYRTPSRKPEVRPATKNLVDSSASPRLIYVSHPSEHKNHIRLIQSLGHIVRQFPKASLLLTLDREANDARYARFVDKICDEAGKLGVSTNISWLGILNPDEVAYALSQSDLLVFPSLAESFGLGLAEAMASHCPVVVSDLPYAHDVCGSAAVYFDPYSPRHIGEQVCRLLTDSEYCRDLIAAAALRATGFNYLTIAERIAQVFETAHATTKRV